MTLWIELQKMMLRSRLAPCVAVSAGEGKFSSDGESMTLGSSKNSDEGKISSLNGTIPVHRNPDTAFSMVAAFK